MKLHIHKIDELLRQQLEAVPSAPSDPDGWDRLRQQLDADADFYLQASLTGLVTEADATGWDRLARKLDPHATADAQLAASLEAIQPEPAQGWEALERKLNQANDEAIDAVVVDRLARTATGGTSGWAALAARLELIGQRRDMIAAGKITEIALLLSLLLLFVRFGPTAPTVSVVSTPPIAETILQTPTGTSEPQSVALYPSAQSPATTATATPVANTSPVKAASTARPVTIALPLLSATAGYDAVNESTAAVVHPIQLPRNNYVPEGIASLEHRAVRAVTLPSPLLQLPRAKQPVPIRYYVNGFISPLDVNQVITPTTELENIDIAGDNRITQGYSAGFLIDVNQGKSGLRTGLIYSKRSYIPTALKWWLQEDYSAIEPIKGYSRFIHHTITLPFHYYHTLVETDKWRFSADVGASMNIIAKSDFFIPSEAAEELTKAANGTLERFDVQLSAEEANNGRSRSNSATESRQLVEPPPGYLEGGGLLNNANFYFGGGLMLERLVTPRWSVYVSPSFGRVVYLNPTDGIGPYRDRIHIGSLRLGGRYLLSNK